MNKTNRLKWAAGIAAFLLLVAAGFYGKYQSRGNDLQHLQDTFPDEEQFVPVSGDFFRLSTDSSRTAAIGSAFGYGGEIRTAVIVSEAGVIVQAAVLSHKETPSFMQRVLGKRFLDQLKNKLYTDSFLPGADLDGISGATYTARGIADGTRRAAGRVAAWKLSVEIPPEVKPEFVFGTAEIVLLFLFIIGIIGRRPGFKYTTQIRWFSMLAGIIFIGFMFNKPLVLTHINRILMGYWPLFQTEIFIYLLLAGTIGLLLFSGKNPYCDWFCPFGAVQECIGLAGNAKPRMKHELYKKVRWLPRLIAYIAILLALATRNPGSTSFEIFGVFFRLIGDTWQFVVLGIVVVASLFVRRPWCKYLCPLKPVSDSLRWVRRVLCGRGQEQAAD